MTNNFSLTKSIDELKYVLMIQNNSIDSLKKSAEVILLSSSIVFGLFNLVNIPNLISKTILSPLSWINLVALLLIFIIFITITVLCSVVSKPVIILGPIDPSQEEIYNAYLSKRSIKNILKQELSNLLNILPKNQIKINKIALLVNWSWYLFIVDIFLIFFLLISKLVF